MPARLHPDLVRTSIRWLAVVLAGVATATAGPPIVTWLGPPRFDQPREGSWKERWLEQRFGLELRPIFIGANAYEKRKPLMMMGGDVPDVYWVADAVGLKQDARNGFACELPLALVARHAPDYVRLLNRVAPEAWLLSQHEGRNYGLPIFGLQANSVAPLPGIWRMDWLRRVGFDRPPETLAEFQAALRAFRYADPDGNGRRDTYGFAPDTRFDLCFGEIYGAHGLVPAGWVERDGRLVWSAVLPGVKPVLALLRQWYAEGLIYPDYFLAGRSSNERVQLFLRGKIGYLPDYARYDALDPRFDGSIAGLFARLQPEAELTPGTFPRGPEGQSGAPVTGAGHGVIAFGRPMADTPEKIVRVLEMFNALGRDRALHLQARFGEEGRHWAWRPERGLVALPPYDRGPEGGAELVGSNPSIETSGDFFCPFGAPPEWVTALVTESERAFDRRWRDPALGLKPVLPRSDVIAGAETCYRDLQRLQETVFTEIVTGKRDLADHDAFVTAWQNRGGRLLTENANATRARLRAILRELELELGADGGGTP